MAIFRIGHGRGSKRKAVDKYVFGETVFVSEAHRECKVEQFVPTSADPDGRMFFLCDGVEFDADSMEDAIRVVKAALNETFFSLHPAVIGTDLRATEQPINLQMPSLAPSMAVVGSIAVEIEYDDRAKELQSRLTVHGDRAILILRSDGGVAVDADSGSRQSAVIGMLTHAVVEKLKSLGFKILNPWHPDPTSPASGV